jgi:hypothetical protein
VAALQQYSLSNIIVKSQQNHSKFFVLVMAFSKLPFFLNLSKLQILRGHNQRRPVYPNPKPSILSNQFKSIHPIQIISPFVPEFEEEAKRYIEKINK